MESNIFAIGLGTGRARSARSARVAPTVGAFRGSPLLRLAISWEGGERGVELCVQVTGDLDAATAPALADTLARAHFDLRQVPDAVGIVLDLRPVSFLGAAGMRVMDRARRTCAEEGFTLRLIADHPTVIRPLELTGLAEVLGLNRPPTW
ncbi:STAS domain-containing protein [Actinokineospora terrae]|uniref:Anti-sigma factor antagonist n=1 Tax=Actinokineospora terrae TaxID=155974 RepID=A0A1H9XNW0_9PSEU|nr:STAS domain-containing protein [Actinokineospora terrae]SES47830.1 anti-anti-sigma factor [Actinokineospora terrae]